MKNVYGEIGTSFANSAVANPRFAAAFIGQLVNLMGADNVVWGTDSVWYGSPQWQIEAMRRLEIPDDMMAKTKWKTKLGDADSAVKRKIFGQNSARLYKFNAQAEFDNISRDQIAHDEAGVREGRCGAQQCVLRLRAEACLVEALQSGTKRPGYSRPFLSGAVWSRDYFANALETLPR